MPYWSQGDLESLIGTQAVAAIFDDSNLGFVDQATLLLVQRMSDARVDGRLARQYPGPFPLKCVPELVKTASLLFGRAYALARHPEYVRQFGTKPMEQAEAFLEEIDEAQEYLTDQLNAPVPANAGGIVTDHGPRMLTDSRGGHDRDGDF